LDLKLQLEQSWGISRDTAEFRLTMGFRYLNFWVKKTPFAG